MLLVSLLYSAPFPETQLHFPNVETSQWYRNKTLYQAILSPPETYVQGKRWLSWGKGAAFSERGGLGVWRTWRWN